MRVHCERDFAISNFRKFNNTVGVKLETIQDDRVRKFAKGTNWQKLGLRKWAAELPIATGVSKAPWVIEFRFLFRRVACSTGWKKIALLRSTPMVVTVTGPKVRFATLGCGTEPS